MAKKNAYQVVFKIIRKGFKDSNASGIVLAPTQEKAVEEANKCMKETCESMTLETGFKLVRASILTTDFFFIAEDEEKEAQQTINNNNNNQ